MGNANRPTGRKSNPQAMAAASKRHEYTGHPELSQPVDGDTWLTPRWILDRLGAFDLDPCAAISNPWRVCKRIYTTLQDGLTQPWSGRVFMNPPFSNSAPWIRKHAEHSCGISLVSASIESIVWREVVWAQANAILLLHGRTRFCNPDGSRTKGRPLRSVALIAWSPVDARVLQGCGIAGVFLDSWKQT